MEFDWSLFHGEGVTLDEVAEGFEDPFCIRLLPDRGAIAEHSRYFCLGMTLRNRGVFALYSTNGKQIKVLTARPMTEEESFFYNRKVREYF
jgi:uncharacterized DUF497 family protein